LCSYLIIQHSNVNIQLLTINTKLKYHIIYFLEEILKLDGYYKIKN
jgi:hypothetical protein